MSLIRRLRSTSAVLLAAIALARPVAADEEGDTAAQLFRSASAAFARKEYRAAAIGFEEADRRRPHGATMYNAALAWEAAGEPARAADAYATALAEPGLDPAQATEGRKKLEALEKQVGLLHVTGPAGATVSVERVARGALPASFHVLPGEREVTVDRPDGTHATRSVRVAAGVRLEVQFEASAPSAPVPTPTAAPPTAARPPPAGSSTLLILGCSGIGAGAAAFGVGIFLGVKALAARDHWEASGRTTMEDYDRSDSLRTWTNVVWVGAGVLAAAGVVLLIAAPSSAAPATALRIGPGGLAAQARF